MTKRDYIRLARALRHANNEVQLFNDKDRRTQESILDKIVGFICYELKADSPRFNEDKFRAAVYE